MVTISTSRNRTPFNGTPFTVLGASGDRLATLTNARAMAQWTHSDKIPSTHLTQ